MLKKEVGFEAQYQLQLNNFLNNQCQCFFYDFPLRSKIWILVAGGMVKFLSAIIVHWQTQLCTVRKAKTDRIFTMTLKNLDLLSVFCIPQNSIYNDNRYLCVYIRTYICVRILHCSGKSLGFLSETGIALFLCSYAGAQFLMWNRCYRGI